MPFIADDDFEEELQQSDVILDSIFGEWQANASGGCLFTPSHF